jgi:SAM-dependent methyltransferase
MAANPDAKTSAIEVQDTFAPKFDTWYRDLEKDPYRSTFTYGRKKVEAIIDRALADLGPESRVLDVGCGTGYHIGRLRQRGLDVVGIEPGEELRLRARQNNPGATIDDGDIDNLPFPEASFDAVLVIEVLRHLPDPRPGLGEVARVLRPGGVAVVTVAPRWSLNGYALINTVTSRVKIPTFTKSKQSFVSRPGAVRLMRAAGFQSVEACGAVLGPWQVLERVSPDLLARALRSFEPYDDRLSASRLFRGATNQVVLIGRR